MLLATITLLYLFTNVEGQLNSEEEQEQEEEQCGHQATFNKIMDGEITAIDEFPWMALLKYKNEIGEDAGFGCSGTLITKKHVLTTAHCITVLKERNLELFSVRLGEYNTSSEKDCVEMMGIQDCADPPQDIQVENWIIHPKHNKHINDIALVKLLHNILFSDFVRPICVPGLEDVAEVGQILVVAGWGRTEKEGISSVKLKVTVPVVSFSGCYEKYRITSTILNASQHLCAGSVLGKDACTGDSGGPLMTSRGKDAKWKVIGIISTGNGCGLEGWPSIYIRVLHYREWILNLIRTL